MLRRTGLQVHILWLSFCLLGVEAQAERILVAVAANFSQPIKEIATKFEAETGHEVDLAFGASGKFYAQIVHGAPFDAFLSADTLKPDALEQAGLIVPNSRFTYAIGRLVLWSRDAGLIQQKHDVLRGRDYTRLALANPRLAPYGLAAAETLEALDLTALTRDKWVMGENIAQTFQFVSSGNAELGFVARSQVFQGEQPKAGSGWLVPAELHAPIQQDAVILKRAMGRSEVAEFMSFMRGHAATLIITNFGYEVPLVQNRD